MSTALPYIVGSAEFALALAGAILLWRLALSQEARARPAPALLPPWEAPISELLLFLSLVIAGTLVFAGAGTFGTNYLSLRGDEVTIFNGALAQLGMLAGAAVYGLRAERTASAESAPGRKILVSGVATFLVSLPVLIATAHAWEYFLELCRLPTDKQDLIGIFAHADSPWMLTVMILLAVVIAPLTEELVFRRGLFRYFRTRMPHWVALLAPAIFFATLHVNWTTLVGLSSLAPLTVLAMMFSLAYERTGRIGTPIVAHALFNLHTVVLIFSGVAL